MTASYAFRSATPADAAVIEAINADSFGEDRLRRGVYSLRRAPPEWQLGVIAEASGQAIASLQYWRVRLADGTPVLLFGPLSIVPAYQGQGIGKALVAHSLALLDRLVLQGVPMPDWIVVSGAPAYYKPFGFVRPRVPLSLPCDAGEPIRARRGLEVLVRPLVAGVMLTAAMSGELRAAE